jgi:hypothetical protein
MNCFSISVLKIMNNAITTVLCNIETIVISLFAITTVLCNIGIIVISQFAITTVLCYIGITVIALFQLKRLFVRSLIMFIVDYNPLLRAIRLRVKLLSYWGIKSSSAVRVTDSPQNGCLNAFRVVQLDMTHEKWHIAKPQTTHRHTQTTR